MAQVIAYSDNDVVFTEGPFVLCNPLGNGWRIEAELRGAKCPVLPDLSIYDLMKARGWRGKTLEYAKAAEMCDWLNAQVRAGRVVLNGAAWVKR